MLQSKQPKQHGQYNDLKTKKQLFETLKKSAKID